MGYLDSLKSGGAAFCATVRNGLNHVADDISEEDPSMKVDEACDLGKITAVAFVGLGFFTLAMGAPMVAIGFGVTAFLLKDGTLVLEELSKKSGGGYTRMSDLDFIAEIIKTGKYKPGVDITNLNTALQKTWLLRYCIEFKNP